MNLVLNPRSKTYTVRLDTTKILDGRFGINSGKKIIFNGDTVRTEGFELDRKIFYTTSTYKGNRNEKSTKQTRNIHEKDSLEKNKYRNNTRPEACEREPVLIKG